MYYSFEACIYLFAIIILYYDILIINTITYYLVRGAKLHVAHWSRGGLESPEVPGSSPAAAEIFPWCRPTYAVTQTVQIHVIIIATERVTDSRRLKNVHKKKK